MSERLRLNRRHLVEIRQYLREIAKLRGLSPLDWDLPAREQIHRLLDVQAVLLNIADIQ